MLLKHTEHLICNNYVSGMRQYMLWKFSKSHNSVDPISKSENWTCLFISPLQIWKSFFCMRPICNTESFICKGVYSICGGMHYFLFIYFFTYLDCVPWSRQDRQKISSALTLLHFCWYYLKTSLLQCINKVLLVLICIYLSNLLLINWCYCYATLNVFFL